MDLKITRTFIMNLAKPLHSNTALIDYVHMEVWHHFPLKILFWQNSDFRQKIYPFRLSSMNLPPNTSSSPCGCSAKLELSDGSSLSAKLVVTFDLML